jgi:hypothetical protein
MGKMPVPQERNQNHQKSLKPSPSTHRRDVMRSRLLAVIGIVAVVGGGLSLYFVFSMVNPPDASAYVLGGLWILVPYLTALLAAGLGRWNKAVLITLLVALALFTFFGVSFFQWSAAAHADARRQVETAVNPGEDPNSGPAAMRKSGAEIGANISNVFSILFAVVIPPVQFVGVMLPTLIAFAVSRKKVNRDAESSERSAGEEPPAASRRGHS